MIKTRIAGAAAIFTFGLASLGGVVVAGAAPDNAAPSDENGAASTSTSAPTGSPSEPSIPAHLIPNPPVVAHLIPNSAVGSAPVSGQSTSRDRMGPEVKVRKATGEKGPEARF